MRFSEIKNAYELAAARGQSREEHTGLLTVVTIMELAATAFGRAYYGPSHWGKAESEVAAKRDAVAGATGQTDAVIERWTRRAKDVNALQERLIRETILTTLDLPAVMGRARDLVIQQAEEPLSTVSPLFAGAAKATRTDFRERQSIRKDFDTLGIFLQPEGTNVRYEPFGYSEEGYAVAKYSRAIGWTWEARINDDLGRFLDEAAALGYAARLTRLRVLAAAIVAATLRTTPTAGAGGPDIVNLEWARTELASSVPPRRFGAIGIPIAWEGLANASRANQMIPASSPAEINPVYNAFRIDLEEVIPLVLAEAAGGNALDWLAYDANIASWLEFATLTGFEGGPRIAFKLPDTREADLASFDNMTDAMKVVDATGAKVIDETRVLRVAGA